MCEPAERGLPVSMRSMAKILSLSQSTNSRIFCGNREWQMKSGLPFFLPRKRDSAGTYGGHDGEPFPHSHEIVRFLKKKKKISLSV